MGREEREEELDKLVDKEYDSKMNWEELTDEDLKRLQSVMGLLWFLSSKRYSNLDGHIWIHTRSPNHKSHLEHT